MQNDLKGEGRGLFVVIEGIDGAGKTYQVKKLVGDLAAQHQIAGGSSFEPTGGTFGKIARSMELRREMTEREEEWLFMLDRADHLRNFINPTLDDDNGLVILDRYFLSTLAYQWGADQWNQERLFKECMNLFRLPDLLIVLDMPPEDAIKRIVETRGESCRSAFESKRHLQDARMCYSKYATKLASEGVSVVTIDARQTQAEVADSIFRTVTGNRYFEDLLKYHNESVPLVKEQDHQPRISSIQVEKATP